MIEVRPFLPGDEKQIAALEAECFSEPWSENGIRESSLNGTLFFVAETESGVVGYVGLQTVVDEGYITNVAVKTELRRQGVASALLTRLDEEAEKRNLDFITLEVRVSNLAARQLYEKFGYQTEGNRKNFYRHPTEDAIIMTKRRKVC